MVFISAIVFVLVCQSVSNWSVVPKLGLSCFDIICNPRIGLNQFIVFFWLLKLKLQICIPRVKPRFIFTCARTSMNLLQFLQDGQVLPVFDSPGCWQPLQGPLYYVSFLCSEYVLTDWLFFGFFFILGCRFIIVMTFYNV